MPWYQDFMINTKSLESLNDERLQDLIKDNMSHLFEELKGKIKADGDTSKPHIVRGRMIIYTDKEWEDYMKEEE